MQITVPDPSYQTSSFLVLFGAFTLLSIRQFQRSHLFPQSLTEQLKGFAILAVVFSHIGYFLSSDQQFLYPLSVLAGVGVNLFLFLSGFGLTASMLSKQASVVKFYSKRLKRLFLPLWLVISLYYLLDTFMLGRSYPLEAVLGSFLGYYPEADLWHSLNSPLWFISMLLFYYLLFPVVAQGRWINISPFLVLLVSLAALNNPLPIDEDVLKLYRLHILAFPLGMLLALAINKGGFFSVYLHHNFVYVVKWLIRRFKVVLLMVLLGIFSYTAIHSGVGEGIDIEQRVSLLTMLSVIGLFWLVNLEFKILRVFGRYSYEIYLVHWPLLSRYDVFYDSYPAFIATLLYLCLFVAAGFLLEWVSEKVIRALSF